MSWKDILRKWEYEHDEPNFMGYGGGLHSWIEDFVNSLKPMWNYDLEYDDIELNVQVKIIQLLEKDVPHDVYDKRHKWKEMRGDEEIEVVAGDETEWVKLNVFPKWENKSDKVLELLEDSQVFIDARNKANE